MDSKITSQHYEKLFNLSPDMLCIADLNGYFVHVNPAFSRVLGLKTIQIEQKKFLEFVHPDDHEATLREMQKLSEGEQTLEFENRYRHADGHYLYFSWSAYSEPDDDFIYATAREITEQVLTQRKLKQLERLLKGETILVITDARGIITEVNQKFCDISGYSTDELIGKTHKLINSGYHSREFFEDLWQTISNGHIWSGTIKNRKKNGEYYFVNSIITPLYGVDGKIEKYMAIRQDVTDSIKFAAEFNRTVRILNETSAIARVGGWELDVATGELTWTDETFKILEVEKRAGQKPILPEGLQLFTEEYQPVIENAVSRAIEFGESYSLELMARTAKGNELWVYTNGKANYEHGRVKTLSGTIQDIHQKKLAQQGFEKERHKAIQSAKLASLGELAASVAHEINNPIGIIATYAELMMTLPYQQDKFNDKLNIIMRSVDRVAHIVKSLKRFSRTDEQRTTSSVSFGKILNEALVLIGPRLKRQAIELKLSLIEEDDILTNEIELEQVLINLINNAVDAIKEDSQRWISLTTEASDEHIVFAIEDSGKGIPEDLKPKIFEPFFTSKDAASGTGLGLSISKGILEEHGASISLDEQADNTRFVITFRKGEPV